MTFVLLRSGWDIGIPRRFPGDGDFLDKEKKQFNRTLLETPFLLNTFNATVSLITSRFFFSSVTELETFPRT